MGKRITSTPSAKRAAALALGVALATSAQGQELSRTATRGDVDLAYGVSGPEDGRPLVVINGLGLAVRPAGERRTDALVAEGFRVVRFDNRDAGQSTALTHAGPPPDTAAIAAALEAGQAAPVAYDLSDMADDTLAVLDAAGIDSAHVLGHSLGGMIAQVLAAEHPERLLSLISISSTTGDPELPSRPAMQAMTEPPAATPDERTRQAAQLYRAFEGTDYLMTEAAIEAHVAADAAIGDELAAARQGAAPAASAEWREMLPGVDLPALVIHGGADPLFPVVHAEATAEALPDAQLEIIGGLGHIMSDAAADEIASRVAAFVEGLPEHEAR